MRVIKCHSQIAAAYHLLKNPSMFAPNTEHLATDVNGKAVDPNSPRAIRFSLFGAIVRYHNPVIHGGYADPLLTLQEALSIVTNRPEIHPDLYNAQNQIQAFSASHSHAEVISLLGQAMNLPEAKDAGVVTEHCRHCKRTTEHAYVGQDPDGVPIWICAICDDGRIK